MPSQTSLLLTAFVCVCLCVLLCSSNSATRRLASGVGSASTGWDSEGFWLHRNQPSHRNPRGVKGRYTFTSIRQKTKQVIHLPTIPRSAPNDFGAPETTWAILHTWRYYPIYIPYSWMNKISQINAWILIQNIYMYYLVWRKNSQGSWMIFNCPPWMMFVVSFGRHGNVVSIYYWILLAVLPLFWSLHWIFLRKLVTPPYLQARQLRILLVSWISKVPTPKGTPFAEIRPY